jgi:hypothetical protein
LWQADPPTTGLTAPLAIIIIIIIIIKILTNEERATDPLY